MRILPTLLIPNAYTININMLPSKSIYRVSGSGVLGWGMETH